MRASGRNLLADLRVNYSSSLQGFARTLFRSPRGPVLTPLSARGHLSMRDCPTGLPDLLYQSLLV